MTIAVVAMIFPMTMAIIAYQPTDSRTLSLHDDRHTNNSLPIIEAQGYECASRKESCNVAVDQQP